MPAFYCLTLLIFATLLIQAICNCGICITSFVPVWSVHPVPGDYVLRFYDNEDRIVLAEHAIKLMPAEITITVPEEAGTGTELELSWIAPKGLDSFINVQLADEKSNYHAKNHIYTKKELLSLSATTFRSWRLIIALVQSKS